MPEKQKRQPRLKDSCDRCSIAKVRCNKDKPSCSRCHQKGLSCGYSFSRRAGRRTTTASVDLGSDSSSSMEIDETPSLTSSPDLSSNGSEKDDLFDAWSFPTSQVAPTTYSDVFEDDLFRMANGSFGQAFPSIPPPLSEPSTAMESVPDFPSINNNNDTFIPPEPSAPAPLMSRTSSTSTTSSTTTSIVSSHAAEALRDELANLSDFAASMSRKFDAVVRTRMQYRDVYSEFGVPLEEFEATEGGGGVATPDLSELGMLYSISELRRRLKWLEQDVENMIVAGA